MGSKIAGCRVVVTGMGTVTALGQTVSEFWSGLTAGRSGVAPLSDASFSGSRIRIGASVRDFNHKSRLAHWRRDQTVVLSDRYSWLAAAAADEAIKQCGLELPLTHGARAACIIGSGAGGQITAETACRDRFIDGKKAVHPLLLLRTISSSAAAHIGIELGIKGPTFSICSAGASASHAIGVGRALIRDGFVDVAIVGGSDSMLTYGAILACDALHLLSPEGCFPFSQNRNGTVLAEGAGVLILESQAYATERGAKILAELCGFGMTSNATDMLHSNDASMSATMDAALSDAELGPENIDYINANGTGTVSNDQSETIAIKKVFGRHAKNLAVSSTKSMHGECFGAGGAIEAIACIKAMETDVMPPTIGLAERDPVCDLDYVPNVGRLRKLRHTMSNTFALGGLNAVLVFGPPPSAA
ncbi:beta-ketoacyl-[acyl-carrier-protein] synthase family protein [Hyphomicrobium sp. DY-1]|uniref:beta-ketoacyl-[acyl-carrier-protein] synthase family protein n=1 Tax=Hyphomicrobium sp. DY-1 TaxID=3075650 RepID=UPI0039C398D7